jgi:hypothetical protein
MKVILLTCVSLLLISCGKVSSKKSATWESPKNELRDVKMSGVHSGVKWEGKVASMFDSELFDKPALSFDIISEVSENPCRSAGGSKGVMVTIRKEAASSEADYDRYISFYDMDSSRYLASPNFEYKFKKNNAGVVTSLGVLFDINDREYGLEGYVDVVDCRNI